MSNISGFTRKLRKLICCSFLLALSFISVADCMAQNFGTPAGYPTQTQPLGIAQGDFNGDGNIDLIVANSGSQNLSLYLGQGDGTFAPAGIVSLTPVRPVVIADVPEPISVATGDFNGDGRLDIAVGFNNTNVPVQILFGNGDGTFQPGINQPNPNVGTFNNLQLAAVDLNGDGHPDLIAGTDGGMLILLNDGAGGFNALSAHPFSGAFITNFAAGDINQDGRLDLIGIAGDGSVQEALGNGDGTFQAPITIPFPATSTIAANGAIALADFNRDGRLDIVYTEFGNLQTGAPPAIHVNLQRLDGTFNGAQLTITPTFHPFGLLIGDFNGDGSPDIATLSGLVPSEPSAVVVYQGQGILQFSGPNTFAVGASPLALLSASLTNATALDIVTTDFNANQISALVNQGANTLTLTSSPNPSALSQAVLLSATVHPRFSGGGGLSGSVMFTDGPSILGTSAVNSGGTASVATSFSKAGNHSILAVFSGNTSLVGGSSATITQVVSRIPTSTALTDSPNPSAFGQQVTFGISVISSSSGRVPTGTVKLFDGSTIILSGTLDNAGRLVLGTSSLGVGSHTITALYSGDANSTSSTSTPISQVITTNSSSITLLGAPNPSSFGQQVTLTAAVSASSGSGLPTGTVSFNDGTTTIGSSVLDGTGRAALTTSSLAVGTHNITALYSGDSNFSGSTSANLPQVVNKAATTATITAAPNPSSFGQQVTLVASVSASSGSGLPTGTVTFNDGTTTIGSSVLDGTGHAMLTPSSLTVGTHNITALYSGDSNFSGSTSASLPQVVNKATSVTTLASTPNPSTFGQKLTLTATVSGSASATPTGTVTFSDGTLPLGTATLDSGGRASFVISSLSAGTHNLIASYSGDGNNTPSTSAPVSQAVTKISSTATLLGAPNPSSFGQQVTLTATVSASSGSGLPTGPVTFSDGNTSLGTVSLDSAGKALLNVSSLGAGTHNIVAIYPGDSNFSGSSSGIVSQVVNKTASGTTLVSIPNPSSFGQQVTLTAAVSASSGSGLPTGTVSFNDGTTTIGSSVLDGTGHAALTTSSLAVGTHTITALYSGDSNLSGSTSASLPQVVDKAATTATITAAPNPSTIGQTVTLNVLVKAQANGFVPTGTVVFSDGNASLGTVSLDSAGKALLNVNSFSTGTHSIVASYLGDSNFSGSSAGALSQVVNKIASATTVTSAPNPSTFGQKLTLTATVSGAASATPTGTVTFSDGTLPLGTATLDSGGRASFVISSLSAGTHNLNAGYSGDATFSGSSSAVVTEMIGKSPSATTLTASSNPSVFGQQVVFTAFVTASGSGGGIPSGSVAFLDGSVTIASAPLDSAGKATFSVGSLSMGTHSISANYQGDNNFSPSAASGPAVINQQVNASKTITVLSSSTNPIVVGQQVTFAVVVTATAGGGGIPSGTVTFTDGGTTIGTALLDSSGQSLLTVKSLAVGTHAIKATYQGSPNYLASNSTLSESVLQSPNAVVTLTSSANPQVVGQPVTFLATVTTQSGGQVNTGTVTFTNGSTPLATVPVINSSASFTATNLPVGADVITAAYMGSSPAPSGGSTTLTETITKSGGTGQDFTVSLSPATAQIFAGDRLVAQVLLVPTNGLQGAVKVSCSGVPAASTCAINPSSSSFDGKNPIKATLLINTTGPGRPHPYRPPHHPRGGKGGLASLSILPFAFGVLLIPNFKKTRFRLAAIMLMTGALVGCGGGHSQAFPVAQNTPPGTYSIVVQAASGHLTHAARMQLTVK